MPKYTQSKSKFNRRYSPIKSSVGHHGSAHMVASSQFEPKAPFPRHQALLTTEDGTLKFPFQRSSVDFNEFRRQASNVIDSKNLTSHFDGTYILPIKFNNKYTDDKLITEGEYNELDQKTQAQNRFPR